MKKMLKENMQMLIAAIIALFILSLLIPLHLILYDGVPQIYVGIDIAFDDRDAFFKIVDEVKAYVNLIIIGSTSVTYNVEYLTEICDYLCKNKLYFIPFMHPTQKFDQPSFINMARERWGKYFLGIYAFDEVGGRQIDRDKYMLVERAENYSDAAEKYVHLLNESLKHYTTYYVQCGNSLKLFTADYALYWFNYKAGYDVVFAEFGWNHSRQLHIALCRGAARVQNRDWGVIITWTYRMPPYLESAEKLYEDMVQAYLNGAKYIIVFNYPKVTEFGVLTTEHFSALKKFWQFTKRFPHVRISSNEATYVLPRDYGYGFRGPDDRIWGLWEADALSSEIWNDANNLLTEFGEGLDIIYDDKSINGNLPYRRLIFWNGTIITLF